MAGCAVPSAGHGVSFALLAGTRIDCIVPGFSRQILRISVLAGLWSMDAGYSENGSSTTVAWRPATVTWLPASKTVRCR